MDHRPRKASAASKQTPTLEDLARRIETLERRLGSRRSGPSGSAPSDTMLRWNLIEEDRLRREIAAEGALRREQPDVWRERERARLAQRRESATLARRLRAEGLPRPYSEPTLPQKVKKLRQLEARNRSELATRRRAG